MEHVHGQDGGATTRTQSGIQLVPRVPILAKTLRKRPTSAAAGSPAKRVAQPSSSTTTTLTTGQSRQSAEDDRRIVQRVPEQRQLEQLFPPGQSVERQTRPLEQTPLQHTAPEHHPPTGHTTPPPPPEHPTRHTPPPNHPPARHTPPPNSPPARHTPPPDPPPEQFPIPFDQRVDVEHADIPVQDEGALNDRPEATGDDEIDRLVDMHWASMQTRTRHGGVMETLNVRLWDGAADGANATLCNPQAWERLLEAWERQTSPLQTELQRGLRSGEQNEWTTQIFSRVSQ